MILGEAPGREEDRDGVPFVGASGKRLDQLLDLAHIDRNECYVTNVCKCWPPKVNNKQRAPKKAERLACSEWLNMELKLLRPQTIITLGATPLNLFTEDGITQLHGTQFQYHMKFAPGDEYDLTLIAQYHPAAALHNPGLWAVLLDDWEHMPEVVPHDFLVAKLEGKTKQAPPAKEFAVDTENDVSGKISEWSIAYRDKKKALNVMPFVGVDKRLDLTQPLQVMHNAKWDLRVLKRNGLQVPEQTYSEKVLDSWVTNKMTKTEQDRVKSETKVVDTMIAAYCLGHGRQDTRDSGKSGDRMVGGLGLKYLARRHLGMEMNSWKEVTEKGMDKVMYNAQDSVATYLLWEKWKDQLPAHFWNIDMPLLPVLMQIEDRGMQVEPKFLQEYAVLVDEQLAEIEIPFNPMSPKELGHYVFDVLKVAPTMFTETKQPSLAKEFLETIDDPIVQRVIRWKELAQEKSTYIKNYIRSMDLNNRIHCELKQTSTGTGRLSAVQPNLQNVTKETAKHPSGLRKMFIARPGCILIVLDYKQLELIYMAVAAPEPRLLKAIQEGRSIHQETADALGIEYGDGKVVNFLMSYAGSAWKVAQEFHKPISEAQKIVNNYFKMFPGIAAYQNNQRRIAQEQRRVTNLFGRSRRLDGMFSGHRLTIQEAERQAINTPIQGGAGEVVKRAMNDLHYRHHAPMIMQVHDEMIFEVPIKEAKSYAKWLKEYVPTITTIDGVQFQVDVGVGPNWKEAKEKKNLV